MSDYGHTLAFGVFLTPSSARPQTVIGLAQLADRSGLDLVTFQDHPYQPAFLDTWTLMSYAAARTQHVRLAGNVVNLPLRNPAVLARSVASLDLLSGGRTELGIGAGGFWDAIEAMGGRRLAPGEAVNALAEAIEVIRLLWDTGTRGPARFDGRYYRLSGAKRGPAPAHAAGIWVGAYQTRMLGLTGRLADGWLPSLVNLAPGQLAEGNAIIDRAATEAGRRPGDVRRLLNIGGRFVPSASGPLDGPPAHWARQLADLAVTEGISTFILQTDDPDTIRRYAAEVAPLVRELVNTARAGTTQASNPGAAHHRSPGTAQADDAGTARAAPPAQAAAVGEGMTSQPMRDPAGEPGVTATPDDGIRLSSTRLWDESARPARPAVPPPSGYTQSGKEASAALVGAHNLLRDELSAVRDLIASVQKGETDAGQARSALNQMTMRQNNWAMGTYCQSYCRLVTRHHTSEDALVFPHLRDRDQGLGPVLDRLQAEHLTIHEVLDSVDRALVNFIAAPGDFTEVQSAIDLLTDTLLSHLAYEERELIEPLARHGFPG